MFKKLKLKLTLANVFIVVLIFIAVFAVVYITMYRSITSQTDQLMNLLTYSVVSNEEPQNPKLLGLLGNQPFIIANMSPSGQITGFIGQVTGYSGQIINRTKPINGSPDPVTQVVPPLSGAYVKGLVDKAIAQENRFSSNNSYYRESVPNIIGIPKSQNTAIMTKSAAITSDDNQAYLVRKVIKGDNSYSLIFVNVDYEDSLLNSLRFNLIIVGLAGLVLAFAGSLFMAGRAVKPVKTAWERQKDFVADASHELRTPLSIMQTNLELVMGNKEDTVESQKKWLDYIYSENKRMTRLVGDLLLLARADSGQKLLEMKNFSLSMAAEAASAPFIPVAEGKKIKTDFLIGQGIDFYGDEERIKQLIIILLDNAVKYTHPGGRIGLRLKDSSDHVEMVVADTGEGISREHIGKVFDRFYRIDKSRSSESGGTGLGLSIAHWIVKEHGGTISVDSALGKGTIFKIMLPKEGNHQR